MPRLSLWVSDDLAARLDARREEEDERRLWQVSRSEIVTEAIEQYLLTPDDGGEELDRTLANRDAIDNVILEMRRVRRSLTKRAEQMTAHRKPRNHTDR